MECDGNLVILWQLTQLSSQVLPSYIRVIQGDGISYESMKEILKNMQAARSIAMAIDFSSENSSGFRWF